MHPAIESKVDDIVRLCREYGVKRLDIFGSAARGVDFNPEESDADFIVEFGAISLLDPLGEFFRFEQALASILGRDVDLIEAGARLNPVLKRAIDVEKQTVYATQ